MKKAIALIIVIGFITLIMGLMISIYSIYDKISNNIFAHTISEDTIIIKNITQILDNFTKNIKNDNDLKILCNYYPNILVTQDLKVDVNIEPLFNRMDINKFNNNDGQDIFFNNIFDLYKVEDGEYFKSLLLDSLDDDDNERGFDTEIKLYNPYFQDGGIYNYKNFEMILDWYVKHTKDENIYNIPWKKLFFFYNLHFDSYIDCNLINKEFVKILGLESDNISCNTIKENLDKNLLKKLGIMPYKKDKSFLIKVNIRYILKGSVSNISLIYNIKTKKVVFIEKHSIY